jgi:hypothetical protein
MQLDDALARISEIHAHVVKGEVFRGYHPSTAAATGGLALAAAALQPALAPAASAGGFAAYWLGIAALAFALAAWDLGRGYLATDRTGDRRRTRIVLGQLLPPIAIGAVVTSILLAPPAPHAALLPGLWAMSTGTALFATRLHLPRAAGWVALWFAASGAWLLASPDANGAPWGMGIVFGGGMLAMAGVLHADLDRSSHGDAL